MSALQAILAGSLFLALPSSASAQKFSDVAQQLDAAEAMTRKAALGVPIRVQVSYQLQLPTAARPVSVEEQALAVGTSHEAIYKLAARECDHLRVVVSGDCRMTSLNVGNANGGYNQQAGFQQVTGNATFELIPRPAELTPPPAPTPSLQAAPATSTP